MTQLTSFVYFAICVLAQVLVSQAASSPPAGAITIGPGGKYSTVTAGLADTSRCEPSYFLDHSQI